MTARWLGLGAAVALTLLGGCASVVPPVPPMAGAESAASAANAQKVGEDRFSLSGRISVVYGAQSLSGKIDWQHAPAGDQIDFASPLGSQVASLTRNSGGVVLTDSEKQTFAASDAETLTEQRLGWRLPLVGMVDWVRGRLAPGAPAEIRRDAQGRVAVLTQSDWRLEYAYGEDGAGSTLPRRLFMRYLKSAEALEIRMVIDQWAVQ